MSPFTREPHIASKLALDSQAVTNPITSLKATGFKVVQIPFQKLADGSYDPVAPADSQTGYKDIFSTPNPGSCTANGLTQSNCFRLTAAAWDPAGRGLFVGSDNSAEGEIYILSPTA